MKLTDACWVLCRHFGIQITTVSDCTRGDSTNDELFLTEREAWAAEAARARREAERYERDAATWRKRESDAVEKSK